MQVPGPATRAARLRRMEFPQHWAQASGHSPHLGERGGRLTVWGWSATSAGDAERVAEGRLAEALQRLAREGRSGLGHDYYPRTPPREPVLEELENGRLGVLSRNRMGCEVLNTELLLVADVDSPELAEVAAPRRRARSGLSALVGRLVGRPGPPPPAAGTEDAAALDAPPADQAGDPGRVGYEAYRTEPDGGTRVTAVGPVRPSVAECLACEPVWEFARRHPDLGVRVYRTAAGLRVLVTGAQAPPSSQRARQILTELGSDPLYVELCATHGSYRARLTPKPFRIGVRSLTVRWPCRDDAQERRWLRWVDRYRAAGAGFAVCRLLSASGPVPGAEEQRLVELHDDRCRVGEELPLA